MLRGYKQGRSQCEMEKKEDLAIKMDNLRLVRERVKEEIPKTNKATEKEEMHPHQQGF